MLPEFKQKASNFIKINAIDHQGFITLFDSDKNGTLNLQEFEQMILSHNSTYQSLRKEILQLFQTYSNAMDEVDQEGIKKMLTQQDFYSFEVVREQGCDFIDPTFPPGEKSQGQLKSGKVFPWKSLKERYGDQYTLFTKNKKGQLPRQGKIGNCYFVSPLASLYYNYPEAIEQLFLEHLPHATLMKICFDGQWQEIWVDHYFPFNPKKDIPAFGKYLEGAVWGMLLEKAWAKIYGSYRIISGGFNSTTFATLTGAPTDKILTLCSEFKEKFEEWNKCKYPLCVNSRKRSTLNQIDEEDDEDDVTSAGISGNHAYAILKVVNGKYKDGRDMKLIKIRNPWGFKKWKGDQANEEQKAVESELQKFDPNSKRVQRSDKGVFYIDYEHFIKYFGSVEVCFYNPKYQSSCIAVNSYRQDYNFHEIDVQVEGSYYLLVTQKSPRSYRGMKGIKYRVSPSLIGVINDKNQIIRSNSRKINKNCWVHVYLRKKKYLVYSQVSWIPFEENVYILSCYGEKHLELNFVGQNIMNVNDLKKIKVSFPVPLRKQMIITKQREEVAQMQKQQKQEKKQQEKQQEQQQEKQKDEAKFLGENNCSIQ